MAYFIYEGFREDHKKIERIAIEKLGPLARAFGEDAHIFVPSTQERSAIGREIVESITRYGLSASELPGLLILSRPLASDDDEGANAVFVSLAPLLDVPESADKVLEDVKSALACMVSAIKAQPSELPEFINNLQLKPSIWGLGYDFKPLAVRLYQRLRRPTAGVDHG